jgi:hypothetical protein
MSRASSSKVDEVKMIFTGGWKVSERSNTYPTALPPELFPSSFNSFSTSPIGSLSNPQT